MRHLSAFIVILGFNPVRAFTALTGIRHRPIFPPSSSLTRPYQIGQHEHAQELSDQRTLEAIQRSVSLLSTQLMEFRENTTTTFTRPITWNRHVVSKALPLILQPTVQGNDSLQYLKLFLESNREWVGKMILDHGAVMFRGFSLGSAQDVEDALLSFNPNLSNEYHGTSPRNVQGGSKFVFSAAEVPSHYPIAQHIEMSFLPSPPKQLYFSALKAPNSTGGETALADFRKVYQDLPQKLRQKLATKKLLYRRTHRKIGEVNTHDVAAMLSWPDLFGTNDKEEVEARSHQLSMPVRWEGSNNDTFVSEFSSEPFQLHPITEEPVFFNHANVFHWTSFPAELFAAFRRTKDIRFLGHALRVGVKSLWKYGIRRQKMALHVSYGDGSPISVWEMHQMRKAIHKNMVYNRWQQGDLLLIDNFSTSHGRQPTYDSGRQVVVAWSDSMSKSMP
ncbi:taurine catabolism dioxygenase TauD/TfdA family protein [Nitzschia inconspicua]|uniref:Taurine catabolism dioxygenase TauD/TfdA family protein n=1 Tax=Nitzschia inconspicua TaxID=303405 RepID=A0A9K3KYH4_9STRA|nr:taurine catabolism dioxygenase TauD/TfdA family protein [Nitzschia inconspicua]